MWDLRVSESLSVSRIIVHVPPKLERTGEPYPKDVVGEWRKVYGPTFDPRVVVNYVDEDAGPLTKWIGVGTVELHPDDVVLVIDDDIHYGRGHLRRLYDALVLAEATLRSPNHTGRSIAQLITGGSASDAVVVAVAVLDFSYYMPSNMAYVPRWAGLNANVSASAGWPQAPQPLPGYPGTSLRHDGFHYLEAWGGVALRAKTLSPAVTQEARGLSRLSKECWASDDVVISAAFLAHAVPLLYIDPKPPKDENFYDYPVSLALAGLKNDSGGHLVKYPRCLRAIDGALFE